MYLDEFLFIKVILYDPGDIKRIAGILEVSSIKYLGFIDLLILYYVTTMLGRSVTWYCYAYI